MKKRALLQYVARVLVMVFGGVVFSAPVSAAPPNLINYQGSLTDNGGSPVADGNYPMTFRIYDAVTAGTLLYEEPKSVTVAHGVYDVLLGSDTPTVGIFAPSLFTASSRWIEVEVGGEILTPRRRITSVAWSLQTQEAVHALTADDAALLSGKNPSVYDQSAHVSDTGNPHGVTAAQTGAAPQVHSHSGADIISGTVAEPRIDASIARDSEIMPTVLGNDGPGSGLDADMLDGKHAGDFSNTTSSALQYENLLAMITALRQRLTQVETTPSTQGQPEPPTLIETDNTGSASLPHVAMDGMGNGLAVWTQSDGTRNNIQANRYTAGVGWGTPQPIETGAGDAGSAQVAMDGAGNAMAVWGQSDGTRNNIWANRYTAGVGWGTAQLIETENAGGAYDPQVTMDGAGNYIAVWAQSDGTRNNIWANRYIQGSGWGTAQLLETENLGNAFFPQVAMDGAGNAIAVWFQYAGTRTNIWTNRYTQGAGWGTAQLLETQTGNAYGPHVAMDGAGNGLAVWRQSDGTRFNIYADRYTQGSGWGTAQLIETDNAGYAYDPQVAMDGAGNGIAVWSQSDGTWTNIWANRYTAGVGWETAQLLETDNAGDAGFPEVAMDGAGNAIAVWSQSDGTRDNLWVNPYTAGVGWGTAQIIETDNAGSASHPQVAMDGAGNGLALWEQFDGTRYNIESFHIDGGGWGTAQLVETDNVESASDPEVAVDGAGNGLAVWRQHDGTRYNIWANRYTAGIGWGAAQLIETDNAGSASHPQVTMDGAGNGLAVWSQSDGTWTNIWANRYTQGIGWGTAQLIETDNAGDAGFPEVATDGGGNSIAVWFQSDGTRNNIYANRYTAGVGWGTATLLETDNAGDAWYPQVALDGAGSGLAVWSQSDGARTNIQANRYTAGIGWGTAQLIETDSAGNALSPQVALDGVGNGLAVWYQWDGARNNIWANHYTPNSGWGTAQLIEMDDTGNASYPKVALDGAGNGLAVWFQYDGTRDNIWANRYTAGVGWGTAQRIETDNAGDAWYPQVSLDGAGNGLALWSQSDGTWNNIWANRYTQGFGWGTAVLIETGNAGNALSPKMALDRVGNGLAVWYQSDGVRTHIQANRYRMH